MDRRDFVGAVGIGAVATSVAAQQPARRRRLAVITTEWRDRSHAWHMAERFLHGYPINGRWHRPPFDVVSAYVDQFPKNDLSRGRAKEFGFTIYPTIAQVITTIIIVLFSYVAQRNFTFRIRDAEDEITG